MRVLHGIQTRLRVHNPAAFNHDVIVFCCGQSADCQSEYEHQEGGLTLVAIYGSRIYRALYSDGASLRQRRIFLSPRQPGGAVELLQGRFRFERF
jgi:hypothetical protein